MVSELGRHSYDEGCTFYTSDRVLRAPFESKSLSVLQDRAANTDTDITHLTVECLRKFCNGGGSKGGTLVCGFIILGSSSVGLDSFLEVIQISQKVMFL